MVKQLSVNKSYLQRTLKNMMVISTRINSEFNSDVDYFLSKNPTSLSINSSDTEEVTKHFTSFYTEDHLISDTGNLINSLFYLIDLFTFNNSHLPALEELRINTRRVVDTLNKTIEEIASNVEGKKPTREEVLTALWSDRDNRIFWNFITNHNDKSDNSCADRLLSTSKEVLCLNVLRCSIVKSIKGIIASTMVMLSAFEEKTNAF